MVTAGSLLFQQEFPAGNDQSFRGFPQLKLAQNTYQDILNFAAICAYPSWYWCCSWCMTVALYLPTPWTNLPPMAWSLPPFTVTSLACEKSDTLSLMNGDHLITTTTFIPLMVTVVHLVTRIIGWGDAVQKATRAVQLWDSRIGISRRQNQSSKSVVALTGEGGLKDHVQWDHPLALMNDWVPHYQ